MFESARRSQQNKQDSEENSIDTSIKQYVFNVAKKEGVVPELVEEVIANSIRKTYCQNENSEAELNFDFANNDLVIYRLYKVVSEVTNPAKELMASDPLLKKNGKRDGDRFLLLLDMEDFPFSLSQNIGKQIHQEIQNIKKQKQIQSAEIKSDRLVEGIVVGFTSGACEVRLENGITAYWPNEEWKPHMRPHVNNKYAFLIKNIEREVEHGDDNDNIILTRSSALFLEKIVKLEVPEAQSNIIIIKHIIRTPFFNKIIVQSTSPYVDAIGTMVGREADRIRAITSHVAPGERVEISLWNDDPKQLLMNLLFPAKVISLIEKGEVWTVVVVNEYHRPTLISAISEYLGKDIRLVVYDELKQKDKNLFLVWNGNIDFKEFEELQKSKSRGEPYKKGRGESYKRDSRDRDPRDSYKRKNWKN